MENDERNWRRFLDGDKSAFDEIMREHFDHVVLFVNRILHDAFSSEDIAIDVFAYLAFKKGWDGRASLRTYLLTVARSRAYSYLRKKKAHPTAPLDETLEDDGIREVESRLFEDERKKAVGRALETLPEEMRTALYLVYFEELSYRETAKVMKKSEKQIDNLLYRARNALKRVLKEEGRDFL